MKTEELKNEIKKMLRGDSPKHITVIQRYYNDDTGEETQTVLSDDECITIDEDIIVEIINNKNQVDNEED